jgi:[pyruvate, water dikinase]-phosphate phosphotransferase / [pyruvate, water dikinase] kinase
METPYKPRLFVVSDGRGRTCQHVLDAALVQFRDQPCEVITCSGVRSADQIREVVEMAAEERGVIFYTLVAQETRSALDHACLELEVPSVDILGPALSALHDVIQSSPEATPGLLYDSDRERFDRIESVHFTLKHDDGQRPQDLEEADVVLVGVSRSSKSATCFYLAYAGIRAANVPLVPDIKPPAELLALPPERVIGLRLNAMRLRKIREARLVSMKSGWVEQYVDKRMIAREVLAANRLMEEHSWRHIDVSYRAVEEIASRVMEMRGFKRGGRR